MDWMNFSTSPSFTTSKRLASPTSSSSSCYASSPGWSWPHSTPFPRPLAQTMEPDPSSQTSTRHGKKGTSLWQWVSQRNPFQKQETHPWDPSFKYNKQTNKQAKTCFLGLPNQKAEGPTGGLNRSPRRPVRTQRLGGEAQRRAGGPVLRCVGTVHALVSTCFSQKCGKVLVALESWGVASAFFAETTRNSSKGKPGGLHVCTTALLPRLKTEKHGSHFGVFFLGSMPCKNVSIQ